MVELSREGPPPVGGEGPRGFVGGLWHEMGELQFRFLLDSGLRPHHVFLDVACGSLRLGNRIIPYLDQGNYLGIDIEAGLVEHGKMVELGPTWCELKKPEFVISGSFEFSAFSKVPDFALAQSLFTHLTIADIMLCLQNLSHHRHKDTVFYATFFEVAAYVDNPPVSHPHAAFSYTRDQMQAMGSASGWGMDYIGHWNHPRDQKMVRYFAV
jgi:hypothetical protein